MDSLSRNSIPSSGDLTPTRTVSRSSRISTAKDALSRESEENSKVFSAQSEEIYGEPSSTYSYNKLEVPSYSTTKESQKYSEGISFEEEDIVTKLDSLLVLDRSDSNCAIKGLLSDMAQQESKSLSSFSSQQGEDFKDYIESEPPVLDESLFDPEKIKDEEMVQRLINVRRANARELALALLNCTVPPIKSLYAMPSYEVAKATIPVTMYVFKLNRKRLCEELKCIEPKSFVLLKGGDAINVYNTDVEYTFKQEPYFHWAFGVRHPSFFGGIDVATGSSILFIPRLPESYEIWMGKLLRPKDVKKIYGVQKVFYTDEIDSVLKEYAPKQILCLSGENTDSGLVLEAPKFSNSAEIEVDTKILHPLMTELRVIKTDFELDLIKQACMVSSEAHRFVMKRMTNMIGHREYQAESLFLHYCYFMGGCRTTAYTCICGSGSNAAVLHYGHAAAPNDKIISAGDMCLFDMGASYYGYASDITVSFPASGKFTNLQFNIYTAVLKARNRALEVIRPDISWVDVHIEATRALFEALVNAGLLEGDVSAMLKTELGAIFMPHGLGHLMGIDVHDVGGYTDKTPIRPTRRSLKSLRTARVLKENMVLTVEPGCYFIDRLLDQAVADPALSKFIVFQEVNKYRGMGGVRIEDNIVVTEFGCELLSDVPRTIEEIETWMSPDNNNLYEKGQDPFGDLYNCVCTIKPNEKLLKQFRQSYSKELPKGMPPVCGCCYHTKDSLEHCQKYVQTPVKPLPFEPTPHQQPKGGIYSVMSDENHPVNDQAKPSEVFSIMSEGSRSLLENSIDAFLKPTKRLPTARPANNAVPNLNQVSTIESLGQQNSSTKGLNTKSLISTATKTTE